MTTPGEEKFQKVFDLIKSRVPKFRLRSKTQSRLMRFLGFLLSLVGVKDFLEKYWTTLGYTTYYIDGPDGVADDEWMVLAHEGVHALQSKRLTRFVMGFLYMLPQCLGAAFLGASLTMLVLAACGVVGWQCMWLACGLVLLAPLPAYWRMKFEIEAYYVFPMITMEWGMKLDVRPIVDMFTGPAYYFMWPFKDEIESRLRTVHASCKEINEYFLKVAEIAKERNA